MGRGSLSSGTQTRDGSGVIYGIIAGIAEEEVKGIPFKALRWGKDAFFNPLPTPYLIKYTKVNRECQVF